MASTRTVGAGAGFRWLRDTTALIWRHPGPVLGGAAWMVAGLFAVLFASGLLSAGLQMMLKPSAMGAMILGLLTMLPMLYVFSALFAGYLRLIDRADSAQAPSATEVFSVLAQTRTCLRIFGIMVVMVVLTDALAIGAIAVFAPEVGSWYMQALGTPFGSAPAAPPQIPAGFWLIFAVIFAVGMVSYAIQTIAFGQVVFNERGVTGALVDGFIGTGRNLLPLLVLLLASIGLAVVVVLGIALVVGAFMLLAKLVSQWLLLLLVPVYLLFLVLMIAVMYGVVYYLWRDICGIERETHTMTA